MTFDHLLADSTGHLETFDYLVQSPVVHSAIFDFAVDSEIFGYLLVGLTVLEPTSEDGLDPASVD